MICTYMSVSSLLATRWTLTTAFLSHTISYHVWYARQSRPAQKTSIFFYIYLYTITLPSKLYTLRFPSKCFPSAKVLYHFMLYWCKLYFLEFFFFLALFSVVILKYWSQLKIHCNETTLCCTIQKGHGLYNVYNIF